MKRLFSIIGIILLLFLILVNVSKTYFEFTQEIESTSQSTKVPRNYNVKDSELQEEIYAIITDKISEILDSSEKDKRKIKDEIANNFLYGTIYGKDYVRIDYDIKYVSDEILSFILIKEEGINSTDSELHTFNYNVKEKRKITLEEMLGSEYKNIINEKIYSDIENREKENENIKFFHKDDMLGVGENNYFNGISENENFYINEFENVVIIFEKYSIAPGYIGRPEFEIVVDKWEILNY